MKYIKVLSESEYVYPYNTSLIYTENPNYSLPALLTSDILRKFSVFEVLDVPKPEIDHTKNVTEDTPEKVDGTFSQKWAISDASQEEIDTRISQKWVEIRKERNRQLSASDWTQISDNNLSLEEKTAWQVYRQSLRDITATEESPFDVVFPAEPTF